MRPEQLDLLHSVGSVDVHPSGEWAVTSVSRPDFASNSTVSGVFTVPADGSGARRLTRGLHDFAPQLSPDGELVAFLRATEGPPQLHVVESSGGEPVQVTDQKLGVGEFCWAPDGGSLAFIARVPEAGRYGTVEDIKPTQEAPRHFTTNKIQANGLGWLNGRPAQLFVVDLPDLTAEPPIKATNWAAFTASQEQPEGLKPAEDEDQNVLVPRARRLTQDEVNWSSPTFTPDGRAIVLAGQAHRTADVDLLTDLYRVSLRGSKPKRLTNTGRPATWTDADAPCFSANGKWLYFVGSDLGPEAVDFVGNHGSIYVMPAEGGDPERITDRAITVGSRPRRHGKSGVLFTDQYRGTGRVLAVTHKGKTSVLLQGDLVAESAAEGGGAVFASVATPTSQGEVALVRDGKADLLTDFSADLREQTTVALPHEFTATAPDGYPVHGWILKPEGEGPFPVLLHIHGGPYAAYHSTYFDEFQVAVEAGYAVVACNPRGAMGYGSDHGRSIKGDMGNLDMVDILAFFEQAVASDPSLDGERAGVMGGSYGGYMTAWIIGHDHRFKGAVVERGFLDGLSFLGASDIGWFFAGEYQGNDDASMNRQSPMLLTDQVQTPTMVVHSELDLRCPLDQGLNYYARLKRAGVDAELLVFPGENHELTRSGQPWHRRQRFEKLLEWWGKHLPVQSSGRASSDAAAAGKKAGAKKSTGKKSTGGKKKSSKGSATKG